MGRKILDGRVAAQNRPQNPSWRWARTGHYSTRPRFAPHNLHERNRGGVGGPSPAPNHTKRLRRPQILPREGLRWSQIPPRGGFASPKPPPEGPSPLQSPPGLRQRQIPSWGLPGADSYKEDPRQPQIPPGASPDAGPTLEVLRRFQVPPKGRRPGGAGPGPSDFSSAYTQFANTVKTAACGSVASGVKNRTREQRRVRRTARARRRTARRPSAKPQKIPASLAT